MTRVVYLHASGRNFIQLNLTLLTTTHHKVNLKRNVRSDGTG